MRRIFFNFIQNLLPMKNVINPETLTFLSALEINNNREWFNENKPLYLKAKTNVEDVVNEIILKVSEFDKSIERLEAKNCIFRIYKDTRFSKDKNQYRCIIGRKRPQNIEPRRLLYSSGTGKIFSRQWCLYDGTQKSQSHPRKNQFRRRRFSQNPEQEIIQRSTRTKRRQAGKSAAGF